LSRVPSSFNLSSNGTPDLFQAVVCRHLDLDMARYYEYTKSNNPSALLEHGNSATGRPGNGSNFEVAHHSIGWQMCVNRSGANREQNLNFGRTAGPGAEHPLR
jgi:hypothetical protein